MLDTQLEELSAQIGSFRPRAGKDAIDWLREEPKEGADRARAEGKNSFNSTASKLK
jgi:hypothetical protein